MNFLCFESHLQIVLNSIRNFLLSIIMVMYNCYLCQNITGGDLIKLHDILLLLNYPNWNLKQIQQILVNHI